MKRQAYIDLLIGQGREDLYANDWFAQKGMNMDMFVENDVINFHLKGAKPTIYTNWNFQTSGQLPVEWRTDTPDSIKLDKFHSSQFPLPKIDLEALPYDKAKSIMDDTRLELQGKSVTKGIWNIGPYQNTTKTPLIVATGAVGLDGFKLITVADISSLRVKMNTAYPGLANAKSTLVIDIESFESIITTNPTLLAQQSFQSPVGSLGNVRSVYISGFEVIADGRLPYYTTGVAATAVRKAFGASLAGTEKPCALAFYDKKTYVSALGTIEEFGQQGHPGWQGDVMSFKLNAYNGPLSLDLQNNILFCGGILRP